MNRPLFIYMLAILFAVWENAYFGHNAFPRSDAELLADGIVLLLTAAGVLCSSIESFRK